MRRFILISLFIAPLLASEAFANVVVIVRREAEAGGNYVRVCDIARVEGPKEQAAEVARTVLGPTPPRGQSLEISRWDIESRLYEMGFATPVTFSGNDRVKVVGGGVPGSRDAYAEAPLRELQPINTPGALQFDLSASRPGPAQARQAANPMMNKSQEARPQRGAPLADGMSSEVKIRLGHVISGYLSGKYDRNDLEVESKILALSDSIPYDAYEVAVEEAVGGKVPGKATLRLRVRDTVDAKQREVVVDADTQVFGLAPVAARRLSRGEVLSKRDVKIQRVRMESGKGYLPPDLSSVEGRELTGALDAGSPVLAGETTPTEAVKRGDKVITDTAGNGWRIRGNAIALESGMVGDLVKVQDSTSKAKLPARVIGRGKVEVLNASNR